MSVASARRPLAVKLIQRTLGCAASQPSESRQDTALDLLTDSGNPLLGPFGAILGFGQLEPQATDLIPCPDAKLLKRFFRVPFNTPDMLVRFAPDPLRLGLGLLCPLLCLRRFAIEASELRHRP